LQFSASWFVLALAGIRRLVVQTKAIDKEDLIRKRQRRGEVVLHTGLAAPAVFVRFEEPVAV